MKECPKCGVWMYEFDPRTETEKCHKCGYEKKIANVREYYIEHDVTYKLLLSSWEEHVKPDKAFHFCLSSGIFTDEKATSLAEFAKKVRVIRLESLEYHLTRGDFERWITDVIGDPKLAKQIGKLREQNRIDSKLRGRLYKTILVNSTK